MKKVISVMLVIGMMVCFCGCGGTTSDSVADIYYMDEKLANYYSNYTMSDSWEEIDGNNISGKYSDFNGMVALWMYEDEGGFPVDIDYSIKVAGGKAKLILYYTDGKVVSVDILKEYANYDISGEEETSTIVLQKGLSCIKLVGTEDADVEFDISVNIGSFIGLNH